jgi:hypothetical protein
MLGCAHLVGAVAALSLAAKGQGDAALAWRSGEMVPHLEVRLGLEGADERRLTMPAVRSAPDEPPPPCIGDFCQVRVEVPGFATRFGRPHRSELFVALLDRVGIEPFATIAWAFVATGLRLDWSPPAADAGDPAAGRAGWGSVFVRLRLRIDPMNHPVFPHRNRSRYAGQSWSSFVSPRA